MSEDGGQQVPPEILQLLNELLAIGKVTLQHNEDRYLITLSTISVCQSSMSEKIHQVYCFAEYIITLNGARLEEYQCDGTLSSCAYKVIQHVIEYTKPN